MPRNCYSIAVTGCAPSCIALTTAPRNCVTAAPRSIVGDLQDIDTVREAVDGVRAAYFVYPISPGLLEATATFAQAAEEAGVTAIVNMSQISARRGAASDAARIHWLGERVLDWSPIAATHLRPTYFAEWFTIFGAEGIREEGVLRLPFATGATPRLPQKTRDG